MVNGHGIMLSVGDLEPANGFYTTVFTAATSFQESQTKAIARMRSRWEMFYPDADLAAAQQGAIADAAPRRRWVRLDAGS
jgi:hypothetical protein